MEELIQLLGSLNQQIIDYFDWNLRQLPVFVKCFIIDFSSFELAQGDSSLHHEWHLLEMLNHFRQNSMGP